MHLLWQQEKCITTELGFRLNKFFIFSQTTPITYNSAHKEFLVWNKIPHCYLHLSVIYAVILKTKRSFFFFFVREYRQQKSYSFSPDGGGGGKICRLALFSLSPQICNEVLFCPNSTCGDVLLENTSVGFVFTSMQLLHYLIYLHMDYYFFKIQNHQKKWDLKYIIHARFPCLYTMRLFHVL